MGQSGGPNIINDSIIFNYDTGDVANSYIGEPTTNICTGAAYSIYNSGATNIRNSTDIAPPVSGYEVVKVTADSIGTYGQCILWNAPYATSPSFTITNSVYAYLTAGSYVQVGQHWYPWYYGNAQYITKNKWVRISETYNVNEGGSYGSAAMVYSTDGIAYFSMPQYEIKSHMTPFVTFNGTRSNTQGLLDLSVNKNSLDLTNVSFNSNAQILFDGINDYIDISNTSLISGYNDFTIEALYNMTGQGGGEILGNYGSGYGSGLWFSGMYGIYIQGAVYTPGYPLANGKYHMVATRTNGNVALYLNGSLVNSGILNNSIPSNINWRIGADVNSPGEPFSGQIYNLKVYNRALGASEVAQNYNSYKSRIGK